MNPEALFKLINVMEKPVGGSSPEEAIHPSATQPQREAYQVEPRRQGSCAARVEPWVRLRRCTVMKRVSGTKTKRAFGASRPDVRSSRNPSSSQTYPIARRRRRSLARPSLDRPHAFALAREPFSDPTLPAKPAGFAFSSREEKARRAAPLERRRPLPPRVARAQLCRLAHSCVASPLLVSHASSSSPRTARSAATRLTRANERHMSLAAVARVGVLSSAVP